MRHRVSCVSGAGNRRKCLFCGCVCQAKYWSDDKSGQDNEDTRRPEMQFLRRPATRSGQARREMCCICVCMCVSVT